MNISLRSPNCGRSSGILCGTPQGKVMYTGHIDELSRMLLELGQYEDEKCRVEVWRDHNGNERVQVTLLTDPPQVVCLFKWNYPQWAADTYRPGKWEQWLGAVLLEVRLDRERARLSAQVLREQDEAKRFAEADEGDLFG